MCDYTNHFWKMIIIETVLTMLSHFFFSNSVIEQLKLSVNICAIFFSSLKKVHSSNSIVSLLSYIYMISVLRLTILSAKEKFEFRNFYIFFNSPSCSDSNLKTWPALKQLWMWNNFNNIFLGTENYIFTKEQNEKITLDITAIFFKSPWIQIHFRTPNG